MQFEKTMFPCISNFKQKITLLSLFSLIFLFHLHYLRKNVISWFTPVPHFLKGIL